ncbi:ATP-binding protein [Streptomyces sp. NPDC050549]|uniref:sensor histidine kinase n=1 Tax=Streptomyces sp. NPDC050549 TaxID=3155406 RepID=UPI00342BD5C0
MLNHLRAAHARLPFRTKLAAAFTLLFFLSGALLLVFVTLLARQGTVERFAEITKEEPGIAASTPTTAPPSHPSLRLVEPQASGAATATAPLDGAARQNKVEATQRFTESFLRQMVLWSAVGLVTVGALSGAMGWWLAGRALRPVRKMTAAARGISETNLHERLRPAGPFDELREMGETFDTMLDRLEKSFASQRRFVANASHELRTPLAVQRTSIEVGLADPLPPGLADVREDLLTANKDAEHLIAALLLLAHSDRGLDPDRTEATDMATVARQAAGEHAPLAAESDVQVTIRTTPLIVTGDPVLLKHLVSNLVRNAIQYNSAPGTVAVDVGAGRIAVTNTGPHVPSDRIDGLFEPFRRFATDRTSVRGHGLGLAIVRSIAEAHGAEVAASPGQNGGLAVTIRFTTSGPPAPHAF